jgi:hypothetical protein
MVAVSLRSLPTTLAPRWARIFTSPDIPIPPMSGLVKYGRLKPTRETLDMRLTPQHACS